MAEFPTPGFEVQHAYPVLTMPMTHTLEQVIGKTLSLFERSCAPEETTEGWQRAQHSGDRQSTGQWLIRDRRLVTGSHLLARFRKHRTRPRFVLRLVILLVTVLPPVFDAARRENFREPRKLNSGRDPAFCRKSYRRRT